MAATAGDLPTVRILLESGKCNVSLQDCVCSCHAYILTAIPIAIIMPMYSTYIVRDIAHFDSYNFESNIRPSTNCFCCTRQLLLNIIM